MVTRREETKGEAKKILDKWHKISLKKTRNYKLRRIGPGSWKLEGICRGSENSYSHETMYENFSKINSSHFYIYKTNEI